jgi:hypothetical protein
MVNFKKEKGKKERYTQYVQRMYVYQGSYTYAFEVHFDALRELSVVQNHS